MLDMKWKPNIETGNKEIDNDHRYIFSLIQTIEAATKCNVPPNVLQKLSELVVLYTSVHFAWEEHFQKIVGFEEAEKHKNLHREFAERVQNMKATLSEIGHEEEVYKTCIAKFSELLKDWWNNHIMEEDVKMKSCFEKKS